MKAFAKDAMEFMLKAPWLGNVRELENSIERAVVLSDAEQLTAADFSSFDEDWGQKAATYRAGPPVIAPAAHVEPSEDFFRVDISSHLITLEELSNRYIDFAVRRNHGAKDKTAGELGIDRKTLYRRLSSRAGSAGLENQNTAPGSSLVNSRHNFPRASLPPEPPTP